MLKKTQQHQKQMAVHENWLLGIEMILQFRYLFYMITIY